MFCLVLQVTHNILKSHAEAGIFIMIITENCRMEKWELLLTPIGQSRGIPQVFRCSSS